VAQPRPRALSARVASTDDPVAERLRGFGPVGIVAMLAIYFGNGLFVPLSALLVLAWAWRSRTPWPDVGFVRPASWARTVAVGVVLGVALKLVMKAVVMPLLGADPINRTFQYLTGNAAAVPTILYAVVVGAAFGEETLFRGWMFERFGRIFGSGSLGKVAIVLITSAWFGAEHYALQGVPGVQQATIVGLVFGTIFAATGQLFLLMIAHAAFDLTAVAIIYWGLESDVARLIFG
jgi:uncharacterized protein